MIPPPLFEAISATGGGRVTLVIGAGCSVESPTSVPVAARCSQESFDRLVANGSLMNSDCSDPSNLSLLADCVFSKTGSQALLVNQLLNNYKLRTAPPNRGYRIAAALLREGAISSVVTLNFDLALSTAVSALGVGDEVGLIDGPECFDQVNQRNVFYLHRNANSTDANKWVLRTGAIETEWKDRWEAVVAPRALASPVVVFVGLGSAANVLMESTELIRKAMPGVCQVFQVDPSAFGTSEFSASINIQEENFVQMGWNDFMEAMSRRVVSSQVSGLDAAALGLTTINGWENESVGDLLVRLKNIGLLGLGSLRSAWLLKADPYISDEISYRDLIADMLLGIATVARKGEVVPIIHSDGIVEFNRDEKSVGSAFFASGGGTRVFSALEAELGRRKKLPSERARPPTLAFLSGILGSNQPSGGPKNVVGDVDEGDLVVGPFGLKIALISDIRSGADDPKNYF